MELNVCKLYTMSFCHRNQRLVLNYNVDGSVLGTKDIIKDIGVMITHTHITARASSTIDFVLRFQIYADFGEYLQHSNTPIIRVLFGDTLTE